MILKRGQVAVFVLVGTVFLVACGIALWYYSSSQSSSELDTMHTGAASLKQAARRCLRETVRANADALGRGGGRLSGERSIFYEGIKYTYLCTQSTDRGCVYDGISRHTMEDAMKRVIQDQFLSCIDLSLWTQEGYDVEAGHFQVEDISIGTSRINAMIRYPIELRRGGHVERMDLIAVEVDHELGNLFDLAKTLFNLQEENGWLDEDALMRTQSPAITLRLHQPYPDAVFELTYIDTTTREETVFRFAWDGPDEVALIGQRRQVDRYPACVYPDGSCVMNTQPQICSSQGGSANSTCPTLLPYTADTQGSDCGEYEDGESWCLYDDHTGFGFDRVGTRHYKQTCRDGKILTTECRDFRQEICVESKERPLRAVCRPNRWEDCVLQTDQASCEDIMERDCYWAEYLAPEQLHYQSKQYKDTLCHPHVPPGFRFWQIRGSSAVCEMANEMRHCTDISCPQFWTDANSIYCSAQGDCGNGYNIAYQLSYGGYTSTDSQERDIIFTYWNQTTDKQLPLPLTTGAHDHIADYQYYNERANTDTILQDVYHFAEEAASWTACTFCDCIGDIVVGDCSFNKYIHADTRCSLWRSPSSTDACSHCGDDLRPCTEYWCRSLGACTYTSDAQGFGTCSPMTMDQDFDIYLGLQTEGNQEDGTLTRSFLGQDTGWELDEPLAPFDQVRIMLNTTAPASCEVSSLPWVFDDPAILEDVPLVLMLFRGFALSFSQNLHNPSGDGQHYVYEDLIMPYDRLISRFRIDLEFNSLLDLSIIDRYHERFNSIKSNFDKFINRFSGFVDVGPAREQIDTIYSRWYRFKPALQTALGRLGDASRLMLIESEQGNEFLFFRCHDGMGHSKSVFFKYKIMDDTEPAQVHAEWNESSGMLSVFSNEPVICTYSEPSQQAQSMDCDLFRINSRKASFTCTSPLESLPGHGLDIRCVDQPPILSHYVVNTEPSTALNTTIGLPDDLFFLTDNALIIKENRILRDAKVSLLLPGVTQIGIIFPFNVSCGSSDSRNKNYLAYEPADCAELPEAHKELFLSEKQNTHKAWMCNFSVPPDRSLHIGCHENLAITPNINITKLVPNE